MKLPVGEKSGETIALMGDILAVKSTYAVENDYSVHIRFDKELAPTQLFTILGAARKKAPETR